MPIELIIPGLVFLAVIGVGAAVLMSGGSQKKQVQQRLDQIRTDGAAAAVGGPGEKASGYAEFLGKLGSLPILGAPSPKLKQSLIRAGFNRPGSAEFFFGLKLVLMFTGLCSGGIIAIQMGTGMGKSILLVVGGAAVLSMIPNFIIGSKMKKRQEEIRNAMPNAIDLLEVCVSAGLGIDQAWNATADEIREASPHLADEMTLTNFEMLLGARRTEALKNMAERTGAEDIASLASIITQAERFGTSMAEALRTFAETMREIRSQRAEESAEKLTVKMLLPMVIFIFPVVLIVTAGPAALKTMDLLGN